MFEDSLSSNQYADVWSSEKSNKELTVSPLQPPPQNRRKKSSRPHTVYGGQGIKTDPQPQQPTSNTAHWDLASIKPKVVTKDDSLEDPPTCK